MDSSAVVAQQILKRDAYYWVFQVGQVRKSIPNEKNGDKLIDPKYLPVVPHKAVAEVSKIGNL